MLAGLPCWGIPTSLRGGKPWPGGKRRRSRRRPRAAQTECAKLKRLVSFRVQPLGCTFQGNKL